MSNNIKITSSLINSDEMKSVKDSLVTVSEIDGKETFRVKSIEYINDTADNNADEFFYDMIEFIRFLDPSDDAVAYTTPDRLIYLNNPGKIGENLRHWDFIYCHECLHQLWDTFATGKRLQDEGIEYNHMVLNIASDCVINDYLARIRKKQHSDGLITPEYLKEKFDVEYNPRTDTQYSLYMKLIEKKDELAKDPLVQQSEFDGKIKPKSVNKQSGPTPPPPPAGKHSDDFIKGWTDAIKDTLDKKIDPLKDTPTPTGNEEYDKGYSECIENIKKGLEDGVTLSDSPSGNSGGGDLPQIPWDIDNNSQGDGEGEGDNDSDSPSNSGESQNDKDYSKDAKGAQDAANDAKDAANSAQESANNAKANARKAQAEADKAKGAGSKADADAKQKEANTAKAAADRAQKAADKAKEAAEEAQAEADNAKQAAARGDKKGEETAAEAAQEAAEAAKNAAKIAEGAEADSAGEAAEGEETSDDGSTNQQPKPKGGKGNGADLGSGIDWKAKGDKIIEKYKNTLSGPLGEFIRKCKSSVKLEKDGLESENNNKGLASWNEKLASNINGFIKKKLFQKRRRYESTYSRVKRGSGYVEYGKPINPGKRIKENKFPLSVAFYIDRSGSMSNCLDKVFAAKAAIGNALTKHFKKDPLIDKTEYRQWVFDDYIQELPWNKTCSPNGGTMTFESLLKEVEKNSKTYLVNVIITDAGFSGIKISAVKQFLDEMEGMIYFVCNPGSPEIEAISQETKYKTKLIYILADNNFEISK